MTFTARLEPKGVPREITGTSDFEYNNLGFIELVHFSTQREFCRSCNGADCVTMAMISFIEKVSRKKCHGSWRGIDYR